MASDWSGLQEQLRGSRALSLSSCSNECLEGARKEGHVGGGPAGHEASLALSAMLLIKGEAADGRLRLLLDPLLSGEAISGAQRRRSVPFHRHRSQSRRHGAHGAIDRNHVGHAQGDRNHKEIAITRRSQSRGPRTSVSLSFVQGTRKKPGADDPSESSSIFAISA